MVSCSRGLSNCGFVRQDFSQACGLWPGMRARARAGSYPHLTEEERRLAPVHSASGVGAWLGPQGSAFTGHLALSCVPSTYQPERAQEGETGSRGGEGKEGPRPPPDPAPRSGVRLAWSRAAGWASLLPGRCVGGVTEPRVPSPGRPSPALPVSQTQHGGVFQAAGEGQVEEREGGSKNRTRSPLTFRSPLFS